MKNINTNEVVKTMVNNFNSMLSMYNALMVSIEELEETLESIADEEENAVESFSSTEEYLNSEMGIALANRKLDTQRDYDDMDDSIKALYASIEYLLKSLYWMDEDLKTYKELKAKWEQA